MATFISDLAAAIGAKPAAAAPAPPQDDGSLIDFVVVLYARNELLSTASSIDRGNYTHAVTITLSPRYGSRSLEFTPSGFAIDSCDHHQLDTHTWSCQHPCYGALIGKELYRAKKSPAYLAALISRCEDGDEWRPDRYACVSNGSHYNCLTFAEWTIETDLEPRALAKLVKSEHPHVIPHPPVKLEQIPGRRQAFFLA